MTTWQPRLDDRQGPKYLRIADALTEDIYAGRLSVGERLPTHRDLAWDLGVTVGTVSRAYAEAERRGLITGEVGRGSYVRAGARSTATLAMPDIGTSAAIEMAINRPPSHIVAPIFAAAMEKQSRSNLLSELINYQPHTGRWEHREAGAQWCRQRGLEVTTQDVLIINGVEHGIVSCLMAMADPGETVLVEELTWSGTRALSSLLRLNLKPVAMDEHGMLPDALEAAVRASGARLMYINPTLQNPTSTILSAERRRAIAEIAHRYGLMIIEDDIYASLNPDVPPPMAHFAPDHTVYLTGSSKTMAPALRFGFAAMPQHWIGRFSAASRANNWMAPPVMGEIVCDWIRDGTADRIAAEMRQEIAARHAIARRALSGQTYQLAPGAFHCWLTLPEPWRASEVVAAGKRHGLSLAATDLFVPGRGATPHALRIALSATADHAELESGLHGLVSIIEGEPEPRLAVA
jgi:DNA-binding transcriptional MocR family regulator